MGTVHFGVRAARDAQELANLYELSGHAQLKPPLRRVVDGRFLESIDEDAWSLLVDRVGPVTEKVRGLFERQAIIVPPGVRGARMTGVLGALGPGDSFRAFTCPPDAYSWADTVWGPAAHERVEELLSLLLTRSSLVRVRAWLAAHLVDATLDGCARALGASSRTLQRSLSEAGHSFSSLLLSERVDAASALLASSDVKVETVARRVGAASASHLARMLRRAGRPPPSQLRQRPVREL